MKKTINHLILVLGIGLVIFYVIPFIAQNYFFSSSDKGMFISLILLMLINPLYSILSCLLYNIENPFRWYLSVFIGLIFLPSIFIFYNNSAWPYALGYTVLAFIGSCVGFGIRKGHHSENNHQKKEHKEPEKK